MNPSNPSSSGSKQKKIDDRDEQLANILAELSDRAAQGEEINIEAESKAHGDLGEELRELWGAVMLANAVGSQVDKPNLPTTPVTPALALELPYSFGDYELLEEVGRGGMGVVFRARQQSLGREVAVKMLLRGKFASHADQVRFQAEAEAAAGLNHPNIVPVYEVGEYEGKNFFSMKYVAGRTLSQQLKSGPLSPRQSAKLLAKVAGAIDFAHRQGVLHRDLKPSNILIDEEGEPHVMDFGLAKQVSEADHLTRTGAVLGTPAYMSPEQASGNRGQVGVASDVYGLGTILFHSLTGKPPFEADSPMEIVLKVLEQDAPLARTINAKADRDLEFITMRCLQKPPDLRYSSSAALAGDLNAYLNDEPLSAHSGRFAQIVGRLFRETHHANVLENWGLLWIWHSLVLIVVCFLTNTMYLMGDRDRIHYFVLWSAVLGAWAGVFWALRRRMGSVTFVERQIAHIWAASMISTAMLFPVEYILRLPVLTLSPVIALSSGMVFLIKAGILSGAFYIQAIALFATSLAMARWPNYADFIFGTVAAACFFFPGWKYYRQRVRADRRKAD
ncbi:MAG: serine/threonine-protein kinase [Pirellulaceae bacterium]|nr:serine/threonine-protein kinase [Pirellulaceae bacterium]